MPDSSLYTNVHLLAVIRQLLPNCANLCDPISKQPLSLTPIDIATLCLLVTGYPPFVDELTLKNHFEGAANGQQVGSVEISKDRETSTVSFEYPTGEGSLFSLYYK